MKHFGNENFSPENYRYVGKVNVPRKDSRDIVTGKATFLDDFTLPQMLIGRALRCPYAHAKIKSINVEKAQKVNGVYAVLTYKDVDQSWLMGWPPMKPILGRELMYAGDPVALVAADTREIADRAIELIEVEYEVLPAVQRTPSRTALRSSTPTSSRTTSLRPVTRPSRRTAPSGTSSAEMWKRASRIART